MKNEILLLLAFLGFGFFVVSNANADICAGCVGVQSQIKDGCTYEPKGNNECEEKYGQTKAVCYVCNNTNTPPKANTNNQPFCPGNCKAGSSCPSGYDPYPAGNNACGEGKVCCQGCANKNGECLAVGAQCAVPLQKYNASCSTNFCCQKTTPPPNQPNQPNQPENVGGILIPINTGLPDPDGGILEIITNLLDWLLTVFLVLAVLAFVITGIQYLLAMGNARSESLEGAKNNFKYAITAVVVVGASLIIIRTIDYILRADYFWF